MVSGKTVPEIDTLVISCRATAVMARSDQI